MKNNFIAVVLYLFSRYSLDIRIVHFFEIVRDKNDKTWIKLFDMIEQILKRIFDEQSCLICKNCRI